MTPNGEAANRVSMVYETGWLVVEPGLPILKLHGLSPPSFWNLGSG